MGRAERMNKLRRDQLPCWLQFRLWLAVWLFPGDMTGARVGYANNAVHYKVQDGASTFTLVIEKRT